MSDHFRNRTKQIKGYAKIDLKAYCLGHEWFESGKAPYRVFRVSDNSEVFA